MMKHSAFTTCFLALFVCLCSGTEFKNEPSWVLTGPQIFYKGTNEEVCLHLYGAERRGNVSFVLQFSETYSKEFSFSISQDECFLIPVPDVPSNDKKSRLNMHGVLESGFKFLQIKIVRYRDQFSHTLIQTDKPAYVTNETVRFRALTLGRQMKPVLTAFKEIRVLDPNGTIVQEWANVTKTSQGLVERELEQPLANIPGKWQIITEDTSQTVHEFTVYNKLPEFQVEVRAAEKVTIGSKEINVQVCSFDPDGRPVEMAFNLTVREKTPVTSFIKTKDRAKNVESHQNAKPFEVHGKGAGCVPTKVSLSNQTKVMEHPGFFELSAIITEKNTGSRKTISKVIRIDKPEFKVKFSGRRYFKVGIPYLGRAQIVTDGPQELVANVTAAVCLHAPSPSVLFQECLDIHTDQNGIVQYSFIPDDTEITRYKVVIKANFSDESWNSHWSLNLYQVHSKSGYVLEFGTPVIGIGCGDTLLMPLLFIGSKEDDIVANVQILSGGITRARKTVTLDYAKEDSIAIHLPNNLLKKKQGDEKVKRLLNGIKTFNVTYNVTSVDDSELVILAFAKLDKGEVLTASKTVPVTPCFPNPVKLLLSESKTKSGNLAVMSTSASPGSLCGITAVDKTAAGILPRNFIKEEKIFSEISTVAKARGLRQAKSDKEYCKEKQKKAWNYKYENYYFDPVWSFDEVGFFVASNLDIGARPCQKIVDIKDDANFDYDVYGEVEILKYSAAMISTRPKFSNPDDTIYSNSRLMESVAAASTFLDYFSKLWLWESFTLKDNYHHIKLETLQETALEGQVFCVSADHGFGLSAATPIKPSDIFSVFVDVPKIKILKSEIIVETTVSVFNKVDYSLPLSVTTVPTPKMEVTIDNVLKCAQPKSETKFVVKLRGANNFGKLELATNVTITSSTDLKCGPEILPYASETVVSSFILNDLKRSA